TACGLTFASDIPLLELTETEAGPAWAGTCAIPSCPLRSPPNLRAGTGVCLVLEHEILDSGPAR
ncbi:MAG: hypothetical protein GY698_21370, partial [Actinomycetia bacterium]|nr:hypothetical protein [Actinomycetes bacterium]